MEEKWSLDKALDEVTNEYEKTNRAVLLREKMRATIFGFLNPKWWKTRKELKQVVRTFKNKDCGYFKRYL